MPNQSIEEKDALIRELQEKLKQAEKINSEMLDTILEQSRHIRNLEEMQKVRRVPHI